LWPLEALMHSNNYKCLNPAIQSWALAAKNFDLLNDRMDVDYCRELGMKKMLVL
jgi:hypothetical protein